VRAVRALLFGVGEIIDDRERAAACRAPSAAFICLFMSRYDSIFFSANICARALSFFLFLSDKSAHFFFLFFFPRRDAALSVLIY